MIKQAVILAAGRGSRMKENTSDHKLKTIPKPLLDINGKPMIEEKIKKLVDNGIEICLVINPDHKEIFNEKLKNYDIKYRYQLEPLGTANALYAAKDFVREELFLLLMGDDIADYDAQILDTNEPAVFGFEVEDVSGYGMIVTDDEGYVEDILEKQRSGEGIVNTGVYIMSSKFFDYYNEIEAIAKGPEIVLTDAPEVLLEHGVRFKLLMLERWHGINTPHDLKRANGHS